MLYKKGIDPDKLSPLTKLTLISKNGLGGLEYEPSSPLETMDFDYTLDDLSLEAEKILENEDDGSNLDRVYQFGGSSGGARPKAHIKIENEDWIVKFPGKMDPKNIGRKEFEANALAKACGIDVNEFRLFDSKICSGYFGVKRFDRKEEGKVHMVSLAAFLILIIVIFFKLPILSVKTKIHYTKSSKECVLTFFYGNKDDHGKNFSFLYEEEAHSYKLSPVYDLTATPNKAEHEMTVNGNRNPTEEDLFKVAAKFKLSSEKCKEIVENIKHVLKI